MNRRLGRAALVLAPTFLLLGVGCHPGPKTVDRNAGRPVPTPKGSPLPGSLPATLSLGTEGGSLSSPDGLITVSVEAGATDRSLDLEIQEITNFAPGAVGNAYRIGPEGMTFARPVAITFRGDLAAHDLDDLAIAYQDPDTGYWVRPPDVVRDRSVGTLTVHTTHFSDWSLVTTPSGRDLQGSFTLTQTLALPFSATGTATLSFAGENAYEAFFLVPGTATAASPIPFGSTSCVPTPSATVDLPVQIAEMIKDPGRLDWGIPVHWALTCGDGTGNSIVSDFDTLGVLAPNLAHCTRAYVGTPIIGPARAQGSYTIDCGPQGTVQATWDFQSSICGTSCTPTNPCDGGAWSCTTGTAICLDTSTPLANGTTCGVNMVCNTGACVSCTAGVACSTNPNPCVTGVTSCATGTETCVDTTTQIANGTTCGTDMVCNAGTCVSCTAGLSCNTNPDALCHAGTTSCSTGTSVCVDAAALPNGTTCGTDMVCNAGACTACAAGVACTSNPDSLCHSGTTSCSTGTSVCVDASALPNGTVCGIDMVCNGGACTACAGGLACTTNPDPLCHAGATSCSTGTSVCLDASALPNGTSCGTNMVCNAGACTSCTSGVACTTNPDPLCHSGTTSCSTGTSVCQDGAALADGTSCGTDKVCSAGACTTCASGATCTTNPDPLCHSGTTSCSTGTSVCQDASALPNGTSCGTGQSCNDGTCVPSRDVTGTRLVTYWPDGTQELPVPAPDVSTPPFATVAALVPRAGGGFDTYAGTFDPSGSFVIHGVPVGTYVLSFVDGAGSSTFLETTIDTVDLGYDVLGRSGAALATTSTPVTLSLAGLTPWTAGDEVQITSSNADVFDVPSTAAVVPAAASADLVDDWSASGLGPPMNLLAPADVLWIHDLATSTATATSGATAPYLAATAAVSVTGLSFTSGVPAAVPAALAPAPRTGFVTGDAAIGIDWRLSQFEAQLPAMMGAASMPPGSAHTLSIGAAARALANPAPIATGHPTLFELRLAAGSADFATSSLAYGGFLDAAWSEWRGVGFDVPVSYALPSATGALTDHATIGQRQPMSASLPTPIVPVLLPVQAPLVNGLGAFATLTGVGTTPAISWSAPPAPSAAPTSYTVEIVRLAAGGSGATVGFRVARWRVTSTIIAPPANLLQAGETYYVRITANASAPEPLLTKPLSGEVVTAWATTLTGTFSP